MSNNNKFLEAVLGTDCAEALSKAASKSERLENVLVPRTIIAWLNMVPAFEYEGEIPGIEGTSISFNKNEGGFSGTVGIGEDVFKFEKASVFHVAASVAVAIGLEKESVKLDVRDMDIERLGKSIDLAAKIKLAQKKKLEKEEMDKALEASELEKAKMPGQVKAPTAGMAAAPTVPEAPTAPIATAPATPAVNSSKLAIPKAPKPPKSIKLAQSEMNHPCPLCASPQFKNGDLIGCLCLKDLAKNTKFILTDDGVVLDCANWDVDETTTFLEAVGR